MCAAAASPSSSDDHPLVSLDDPATLLVRGPDAHTQAEQRAELRRLQSVDALGSELHTAAVVQQAQTLAAEACVREARVRVDDMRSAPSVDDLTYVSVKGAVGYGDI